MTDRASTSTTDEGLRCPECEYNLTGLDGDVCPECGEAFDRAQLLALLAGEPMPIPIWSERNERGFVRTFLITVLEIWISPISFAKRFPQTPDRRDPILFARTCLFVSLVILASAYLPFAKWEFASWFTFSYFFIIGAMALAGGLTLLEFIIAASAFSPPSLTALDRPWFGDALALPRMMRAHLIPLSLGIALSVWTELSRSVSPMFDMLSTAGLVAMFLYWWVAIVLATIAYQKSVWSGICSLIMMPVGIVMTASILQICSLIFGPLLEDLRTWILLAFK